VNKLSEFPWGGRVQPVVFIETTQVKDGVECDVYQFVDDDTKDLGIVRVAEGSHTPLQRILKGIRTIEGFMGGNGSLVVGKKDGTAAEYVFPPAEGAPNEVEVEVGETMQWQATKGKLTFFEVCEPPYEDGRFENLSK
jgi:hypothetical protein